MRRLKGQVGSFSGESDSKKEKKKLIDIGLRRVSLDIEQSYWTVISGYWILRLLILVNQLEYKSSCGQLCGQEHNCPISFIRFLPDK
jgi:hypothetical protein